MSKQKLFQISFTDWGETYEVQFYHEKKTFFQFKRDFDSLLKKYGKEFLDKLPRGRKVTRYEWIVYAAKKMGELGYKDLKPKSYNFTGIGRIGDNHTIHEDSRFEGIVGFELMERALIINHKPKSELEQEPTQQKEDYLPF